MRTLLILLFLASYQALAGVRIIGNGGDIVVCKNEIGKITKVELLDHFEARNYRNQEIYLGPENLTIDEKIEYALKRLDRVSPDRSELYREWVSTFYSETQFRDDIELIDIPDSDHIALPKGCEIAQIANQASVLLPGQKRYTIDDNLWRLLNKNQKAGLILHEVVYRDALQLEQNHSVNARFLAALIASPTLETLSLEEFVELLRQLDFTHIRIQGALIDIRNKEYKFWSPNILQSGFVVEGSMFVDKRTDKVLPVRHIINFNNQGYATHFYLAKPTIWQETLFNFILAPQIVRLHPNGKLALAVLEAPQFYNFDEFSLKLNGHIEFYDNLQLKRAKIEKGSWKDKCIRSNISLYENGQVEFVDLMDSMALIVPRSHLIIDGKGNTRFYESGVVKETLLAKGARLVNSKGERRYYGEGSFVKFNEKGFVEAL